MKVLKETIEIRTNSENEAKDLIEQYKQKSSSEGFIINSAGFTYKVKKAKGEIIDEAWVVKIVKIFNGVWDED